MFFFCLNSHEVTQTFDKARQLCQLGSTDEFSVDLLTVDSMSDMKLTIHYLLEKGLLPNTELNYFWVGIHLVKVSSNFKWENGPCLNCIFALVISFQKCK